MEKKNEIGIYSYYADLHHGEKDSFIREIADELCLSTPSIRRKLKLQNFNRLQIEAIERVIERR